MTFYRKKTQKQNTFTIDYTIEVVFGESNSILAICERCVNVSLLFSLQTALY